MMKSTWMSKETALSSEKDAASRYYKFSDGFCTYYINKDTGEKKFTLGPDDKIEEPELDDFS